MNLKFKIQNSKFRFIPFRAVYNRYPDLLVYLAFLAMAIIAFWQVAFLKYSLKWDMIDCYLPWRYFTGECLQNNIFPWWNPYQHLGYPIHADLRSVWYPEVLIIGSTTGYSNYTLHFLFIFYISLAGFGFFRLSKAMGTSRIASFLAGTCYMLSGYFVGRGQDMGWIIAAAWLPFVILSYLKMLDDQKIFDVLKFCIFTFLMVTGGYQAHTIILPYLLLILFIYYSITAIRKKEYKRLGKLIFVNILALLSILISCSFLIIISVQVIPFINRLGGLPLEVAQYNPFSPKSMLSLLVPYASVVSPEYFGTDISMSNAFSGILIFVFIFILSGKKLPVTMWIIIAFGLFSLLASSGKYLPVREFLFHHAPGMNMFRMPFVFVIFFILGILLAAANGLGQFLESPETGRKRVSVVTWIITAIFSIMLIFSFSKTTFNDILNSVQVYEHQDSHGMSSLYANILLNSIIQLLILLLFLFFLYRNKLSGSLKNIVIFLILIEMIISVQLNIHYTVVTDYDPAGIHCELAGKPSGFPVPAPVNISENSDKSASFGPLVTNTNIFSKNISSEGFNSFLLISYEYLFDSLPLLKDAVLYNPPVYLSGKAGLYDKAVLKKTTLPDPSAVYLPDSVYRQFKASGIRHNTNDTAWISSFTPYKITACCSISSDQFITLIQSDYPGWEVFADNKPVKHYTSAGMFISAFIPAGTTTVDFVYSNIPVLIVAVVSYTAFAVMLIMLVVILALRKFRQDKREGREYIFLIGLIIVLLTTGLIYKNSKLAKRRNDKITFTGKLTGLVSHNQNLSSTFVLNVEDPGLLEKISNKQHPAGNIYYFRFGGKNELPDFNHLIENQESNKFIYACSDVYSPAEAIELIRMFYPEITGHYSYGVYSILCFERNNDYKRTCRFYSNNDFESGYPLWTHSVNQYDSLHACSGKYSCRLDANNPFSSTFIAESVRMSLSDNCLINVTADACIPEGSKVFLVIDIQRQGKQISYESADVSGFTADNRIWNKVILTKIIRNEIQPDDVLKIYAWNNGKTTVYIDNLAVMVDKRP